ncbi:MAG: TatD family hydrolase [archaeon]|jgi:TatD DNase family protein|nr:TatD family hydrolase [archaeon]MDD2477827.1 TatD family hydrolase [Candidatus ainarchaeum sp.]MDD3084661.1 TatD family hydrolase [Candidatus ainarchaeum sp.]MDD4221207.1 TatD family hydrolase [Candidatus ainarchaeum sp.]MDD4662714.1 TatD family hydrolase [Candidatus ainarchaeum sp.]
MDKNKYNYYLDAHCHYDLLYSDYLMETFKENALKAITCSVDMNSYLRLEEIRKKNIKNIYFAYGLYPDYVLNRKLEETLKDLEKIDFSRALAIGEIGLDYKITKDKNKRLEQKQLLERQLEIAQSLKKPVILHTRYATKPTLEILKNYSKLKVLLHWFTGQEEEKLEALKRGYYLTQKALNKNTIDVNKYKNQILLETDYPIYLNGEKTTPLSIIEVYKQYCREYDLNLEDVKKTMHNNFEKLFLKV